MIELILFFQALNFNDYLGSGMREKKERKVRSLKSKVAETERFELSHQLLGLTP